MPSPLEDIVGPDIKESLLGEFIDRLEQAESGDRPFDLRGA